MSQALNPGLNPDAGAYSDPDFGSYAEPWCTIVVPCYNESRRLQTGLFRDYVEREPSIRFLFVNDGSTDETLAVLKAMRRGLERHIEILDKAKNGGKGEAVRDGMLKACGEAGTRYVGFWDADLATPLDTIPLLLGKLLDNPQLQMIFGSRVRLLGSEVHRKPSRHYLGRIFASAVSVMLRLAVYDTQCGAKLFRITPELMTILAEPFTSRWVFDVEILARCAVLHKRDMQYLHHSIYEYPLPRWEDVSGSKVRASDFFRAFIDILKIHQRYLG